MAERLALILWGILVGAVIASIYFHNLPPQVAVERNMS